MSVVVTLTLKAKPESYDELHQFMTKILPDTSAYKGAEIISCAANPAEHTLFVYEVWDNIDSQKAYMKWRTEKGDVDTIVGTLREPPAIEELAHAPF